MITKSVKRDGFGSLEIKGKEASRVFITETQPHIVYLIIVEDDIDIVRTDYRYSSLEGHSVGTIGNFVKKIYHE